MTIYESKYSKKKYNELKYSLKGITLDRQTLSPVLKFSS